MNRKDRKESDGSESDSIFGTTKRISIEDKFKNLQLQHLECIATLGVGGFGRVKLVSGFI